jgi:uncharacterized SAM-binding protein YcdF (DUF218 family)
MCGWSKADLVANLRGGTPGPADLPFPSFRPRMRHAAGLRPLILRVVQLFLAAAVIGVLVFLPFAGRFLRQSDQLQHADVIMVLGGARIERWLEGVDLYKEGWAPAMVISPGIVSSLEVELQAKGVRYPREGDLARDAVLSLGVPATAVTVLPGGVDNTAAEAAALRRAYPPGSLHRLIVVTSSYHLRRARYAFRRELARDGVQIIMRPSRHDGAVPERWWTRRQDIRYMLSELPKFAAYVAGLGE